jgi:hypothetical protein
VFEPRGLRRGGTVRWAGRELALHHGKGWGRRSAGIVLDDPAAVEPGLLLFAAFIVRGLAEDAGGAAAGGAAAATG